MAEFQYRVITPEGKEKKGTMEGKSVEQVTGVLKAQKNVILSVSEASLMNRDINFSLGGRVSARDYSIFCRQFVSIISAGVSIINALEMMRDQTENRTLKKALGEVYEDVSKGESMAGAMKKHSKVFPSMLCNMVEAGEASGSMEVAFERMAVQFEKENKLKQSVKKAMIYPIVVACVAVGVVVVMLVFVIPRYTDMFKELDAELPAITLAVVGLSNFIQNYWFIIVPVVIAIAAAFHMWKKTLSGKHVLGKLALKFPMTKNLVIKSASSQMARTLSTLLTAGVPLTEAVDIVADTMGNIWYKEALKEALEQLLVGVPLSQPLQTCGLFPPMVYHMVRIGEEAGSTEEMLNKLADYYEEEVEMAVQSLMAAMEPMIIIILAGIVGILLAAVMLPMVNMYAALDNL